MFSIRTRRVSRAMEEENIWKSRGNERELNLVPHHLPTSWRPIWLFFYLTNLSAFFLFWPVFSAIQSFIHDPFSVLTRLHLNRLLTQTFHLCCLLFIVSHCMLWTVIKEIPSSSRLFFWGGGVEFKLMRNRIHLQTFNKSTVQIAYCTYISITLRFNIFGPITATFFFQHQMNSGTGQNHKTVALPIFT